VSPFAESHHVHLPAFSIAPWCAGLVKEAADFPRGAHDDQVDALSQALNRLLLNPLLSDEILVEADDDDDDDRPISLY
jgi:phage terminase large subunit-like protein